MLFSIFLILSSLVNRFIIIPTISEDQSKAKNDMLLVSSEEHLVVGLINVSAVMYAHSNHRKQ